MKNNTNYIDQNIYDKEKSLFFSESWILVAHKNELKNNNDFITFEYYENKIFIQNYNGNLKAFQNICLHRFNTIHPEPSGNRPSSCLYHNWTYGKNGNVIGMSCRNSFEKDNIKELKLKEYELDYCGDFVFLKLNNQSKTSLPEYLGKIYNSLENISFHFGEKTIDYNKEHHANWKLLVENVLECYHCSSIHENSFAKMGFGTETVLDFESYNGHSWCEFPKSENTKPNKIIEKTLANRTFKTQGYLHYYIYPNAFLSTVEGKGFYFGFMLPQSPAKTNLRIRYFSQNFISEISESTQNMVNFINSSSNESLDLVLNEDKNVLENIQSNLKSLPSNTPIFGDEEFRIIEFYKYFNDKIK